MPRPDLGKFHNYCLIVVEFSLIVAGSMDKPPQLGAQIPEKGDPNWGNTQFYFVRHLANAYFCPPQTAG